MLWGICLPLPGRVQTGLRHPRWFRVVRIARAERTGRHVETAKRHSSEGIAVRGDHCAERIVEENGDSAQI